MFTHTWFSDRPEAAILAEPAGGLGGGEEGGGGEAEGGKWSGGSLGMYTYTFADLALCLKVLKRVGAWFMKCTMLINSTVNVWSLQKWKNLLHHALNKIQEQNLKSAEGWFYQK